MILRRRYLGEIMVNMGFVTGADIKQAVNLQQKFREKGRDKKIGEILLEKRKITRPQLNKALRMQKKDLQNFVSPDFINKAYIFKGLKASELDIIASYMQKENFKSGQVVFPQFGKPDKMYIVYSGKLDVLIKTGKVIERKSVYELKRGDVFGEMSFIDQSPRSATVKAKTNSTLFSLDLLDYSKLVEILPRVDKIITKNLAVTISKRLRAANNLLQKQFEQKKQKTFLKFLKP